MSAATAAAVPLFLQQDSSSTSSFWGLYLVTAVTINSLVEVLRDRFNVVLLLFYDDTVVY